MIPQEIKHQAKKELARRDFWEFEKALYPELFYDERKLLKQMAQTIQSFIEDSDKLDNRASNLRVCTQAENTRNRKDTVGICFDKSRSRWIVRYRYQFYGRYDTEQEAKRAYQLAKSGAPYNKTRRKLWHLPTGITKQFGKYRVRPQMNGKRYWLGQFATLGEAQNKLNEWKKEG